jgi:hypothetical protein
MALIVPAVSIVHPSFMEPELILPYNQASGAFDLLADQEVRVRLGEGDLVVYAKRLDLRTTMSVDQAAANQLPSISIDASLIATATYLQRVRNEWDHHDSAAAGHWGIAIEAASRLGAQQGHYQLMRSALLYGYNPENGEGVLSSPGAASVNLPPDSNGNDTIVTYDNGQLAFFILQQIGLIKQRTNQLGIGQEFTILMPQRIGAQIEYANIVQLVQYQRIGAGSQTTAGVVKDILEGNKDIIRWVYDDTLEGKGANGTDAIVVTMPKVRRPQAGRIDTNIFASLEPSWEDCVTMYTDLPAPREIPVPIAGGAIDVTYEIRTSSGWTPRPESALVISAQYQ